MGNLRPVQGKDLALNPVQHYPCLLQSLKYPAIAAIDIAAIAHAAASFRIGREVDQMHRLWWRSADCYGPLLTGHTHLSCTKALMETRQ